MESNEMPVICHPRSRDRVLGTPQVGDLRGEGKLTTGM